MRRLLLPLRRFDARRALGFAAALIAAGCSGDGCGCTEPTPGGFPSAERTQNAVQVRVTSTGIAAIEADPAALVGSFLGTDNGAFPLPASCGGDPEICCDNGQPVDPCGPVNLDFVPQAGDAPRLEINPTNGNGHVQVVTRMRIKTGSNISVSTNGVDCEISIDTEGAGNDSVAIVLDLDVAVDPVTQTTELANVVASVNDLNNGDLDLDGGILCELAEALLLDTVRGQLEDALEDILAETISEISCKQCPSGDISDCGEFADACDGEVCQRGGACLQELGIAGRVIADRAFGSLSSGQLGKMDMYEVAGGYSETTTGGISLGVLAGAIPAGTERDRCGPTSTGPALQASVPRSNFFAGNTRPDTGNPFGIGIGIHKYNLDLFSWSSYESGLLCLNIGASAVDLLTAETFSLVMPSLLALAHNQPAPISLGLRPQAPPVITLGAGTTTEAGDIDEPLLLVEMPGLEIDFYAMLDDQWIRVMTLISDVTLPINLEADDMGSLVPTIGADGAFENLQVINSEALSESPTDLAATFPTLLDLALPSLAGGLNVDLPLLGSLELQVQPDGITSIEANTILAIFADLAVVAPGARAARRAETSASITHVELPEAGAFSAPHLHRGAPPQVRLELGGRSAGDGALEWSVRVDGGLWSPYSQQRERVVQSNLLWLQGQHKIEVRAREVGQGHTTDATPVALNLPIDHVGPTLRTRQGFSDIMFVSAADYVDKANLRFEYKLAGGEWQVVDDVPANAMVAIDLEGTPFEEAKVRVTDSSGNVSGEGLGELVGFHGAGDAAGCECDSAGSASMGGWLLAGFTLLLLGAGRKRRVLRNSIKPGMLALLFAFSLSAQACSCGSGSDCEGDDCGDEVPIGPTGRYMSAASNTDRTVLAAYDDKLGDLVLIDVNNGDNGDELSYRAIDGVPDDVPPTFSTDGYRDGIAPAGPDVGAWTSVALEGDEARVSYQDLETQQLLYTRQGGSEFTSSLVDGNPGERAGLYSSLEMRDGAPTIAYAVVGADGADGVKLSQLRMAVAGSASPNSSGDWTLTVLDEVAISCAGLCGDALECVEVSSEVGPACTAPTADCAEPCGEEDACVAGACLSIEPPPASVDLALGTGLFANNLTLPDGSAAVVFYRRSSGDLIVAHEQAGAFTLVDLDVDVATDRGASATATLGSDGLVHIAYQDAIGDQVMYLAWDGTSVVAGPELVDDGVRTGDLRSHPVGAGMSIAQFGSEILIAYQDGLTADLVVSRGSAGSWARADVLTGPVLDGFYNQLIGDRLATYSYDRTLAVPGAIVVNALP